MSDHRTPRAAQRLSRSALPAVALAGLFVLAGCGKKPAAVDPETSAALVQPVARVELKIEKVAPGSRTGEEIYKGICAGCHDAGSLGAPKTGDAAAWAPRLALGHAALTKTVITGKNAMPPRGGGSNLTDEEVARAVAVLANKAGAKFVEPPVAK